MGFIDATKGGKYKYLENRKKKNNDSSNAGGSTKTTSAPTSVRNNSSTSAPTSLKSYDTSSLNLTDAQRQKLQEKGYNLTGTSKKKATPTAVVPGLQTQAEIDARNAASASAYKQAYGGNASWDSNANQQGQQYQISKEGVNSAISNWGANNRNFFGTSIPTTVPNKLPGQGGFVQSYVEGTQNLVKNIAQDTIVDPALDVIDFYKSGAYKNATPLEQLKVGAKITSVVTTAAPLVSTAYKGVTGLAKLTSKYGVKAGKSLWNALKTGGKMADDAVTQLAKNGDDLTASAIKSVESKTVGNQAAGTADDAVTLNPYKKPFFKDVKNSFINRPITSTISTLGTAALSLGIGDAVINYEDGTSQPTQPTQPITREAITFSPTAINPVESSPVDSTTKTSDTPSDLTQASVTSPTPFSAPSAMTSSVSAPSTVSGGNTGSVSGGAPGIGGGANAMVGEPQTDRMTAAQMATMELDRARGKQGGVVTGPVGDQVDLAQLAATRDATRALLEQFDAQAVTMPEYKQNMQILLASNLANLNAQYPPLKKPVTDTPEQIDYMAQFEENVRQEAMSQMDSMKEQYGMTDNERKKAQIKTQLQAVSDTYQAAIDDIKANPNMPKGLAARRMTEVFEDQKFAANTLLSQLQQVQDELDIGNQAINNYFGIKGVEGMVQDQVDKERKNRIDQFGYLTDSGAIGGLDDSEIRQWSQATGIPEASIQAMKKNALTPDVSYDTRYEKDPNTGELYAIVTDKNNPLAQPQIISMGNFGATRNPSTGGSGAVKEEKPAVIYTDKTLPVSIKSEIIATLQANPGMSEADLFATFPEVDEEVLTNYHTQYSTEAPEEQGEDGVITSAAKSAGGFVKSIWDKLF